MVAPVRLLYTNFGQRAGERLAPQAADPSSLALGALRHMHMP
jgi:hypothetical protein